jgi:hypothetical protein
MAIQAIITAEYILAFKYFLRKTIGLAIIKIIKPTIFA